MAQATNTEVVRQLNLDLVRKSLMNGEGKTKSMIARETGMSLATCDNLLEILIESNEVIEGKEAKKTGGRPATVYYYNKKNGSILCIYVIVEKRVTIDVEICDRLGHPIKSWEVTQDHITAEDIYEQIEEANKDCEVIEIISIGIPGFVSDGRIEYCDEPMLNGVNVKQEVEEKFNISTIVGAEKNYKVYGYFKRNDLHEKETLVYLLTPEDQCMGAGIMVDGNLIRGGDELAGEIMYLPYYYLKKQGSRIDDYIEEIPFAVCSLIATVAPKIFVVAGPLFDEEKVKAIHKKCKEIIPDRYIPKIDWVEDTMVDYRQGLKHATLEKLGSGIKLVSTDI